MHEDPHSNNKKQAAFKMGLLWHGTFYCLYVFFPLQNINCWKFVGWPFPWSFNGINLDKKKLLLHWWGKNQSQSKSEKQKSDDMCISSEIETFDAQKSLLVLCDI
jgi:hypothetical protein